MELRCHLVEQLVILKYNIKLDRYHDDFISLIVFYVFNINKLYYKDYYRSIITIQ